MSSVKRLKNTDDEYPISESCFKDVAKNRLLRQSGFVFVNQLRRLYSGKIIVQPFPMLSSNIKSRDDWHLAKIYADPIAVSHILLEVKDRFLEEICDDSNSYLLPYPDKLWRKDGFTPSQFMNESDYLHPNNLYGELVLMQMEQLLTSI